MSEQDVLGRERVLVVGAGSLGSVYGARLAQSGVDVQLLAREPHARAIQGAGGIRLETSDGASLAPLRAEWRPENIEPAEIVIVLTKTFDTDEALRGLEHVRRSLRIAVSFQNGIEKDERLFRWCGAERVVGGVSMVGGTLVEPGLVRHTGQAATIVGELPAGTSERVERLASLFTSSGLNAIASPHVRRVEWAKLVHALPSMGLPALTRLDFHATLQSPELADLYVRLVREGAAVAAATGNLLDDSTLLFPVTRIVEASDDAAIDLVLAQGRRLEEAGMTGIRVSLLQSIERGSRLEIDDVYGFVVREGARLGVPVPTVDVWHRLLTAIDRSFA